MSIFFFFFLIAFHSKKNRVLSLFVNICEDRAILYKALGGKNLKWPINKSNPGFRVYVECEHPRQEQLIYMTYIVRKEVLCFGHAERLIEKCGVNI